MAFPSLLHQTALSAEKGGGSVLVAGREVSCQESHTCNS